MKKIYQKPEIQLTVVTVESILAGSVKGVTGTGALNTNINLTGGDTTDEYLSKENYNLWDED